MVEDLVEGKSSCVAVSGLTNAGKTYTMQGDEYEGGLLTRTVDILFNSVHNCRAPPDSFTFDTSDEVQVRREVRASASHGRDRNQQRRARQAMDQSRRRKSYDPTKLAVETDTVYAIFVSYVEIVGNKIFDLLDEYDSRQRGYSSDAVDRPSKRLRERDGRTYIQDVTRKEIHSPEEAFALLRQGQQSQKVAATNRNSTSCRSHSFFKIEVVQALTDESGDLDCSPRNPPHTASISLLDMAGSERADRTGDDAVRRAEANMINESLLVWRRCIRALHEGKAGRKPKIPYNDSTLTKCVKPFFEGKGQMVTISCISPAEKDLRESTEVLKFSSLFQSITTTAEEAHKFIRVAGAKEKLAALSYLAPLDATTVAEAAEVTSSPRAPPRTRRKRQPAVEIAAENRGSVNMDDFEARIVTEAQALQGMNLELGQLEQEKGALLSLQGSKQAELDELRAINRQLKAEHDEFVLNRDRWEQEAEQSHTILRQKMEDHEALQDELDKLRSGGLTARNASLQAKLNDRESELRDARQQLEQLEAEQQAIAEELLSVERAKQELFEQRNSELDHRHREVSELDEETENAIEAEHEKTRSLQGILAAVRGILGNEKADEICGGNGNGGGAAADRRSKLHLLEESMAEVGMSKAMENATFAALHQSLVASGIGEALDDEPTASAVADDETAAKENAAIYRPPVHRHGKRPNVLDHIPDTFQDPGGEFQYKRAKKQVGTPKVKHLFRNKKVAVDEVRLHTQEDASHHTMVKGKVQMSVTGKGASVTFYGIEDKTVDPTMSLLDPTDRKSRRARRGHR